MKNICHGILSIAPRIQHALAKGKPIVALQSTIISHGMPYPQNKQCAKTIQQIIEKQGAVPATVAVIDGKIKVGLSADEIERLAFEGTKVSKISRRDLPRIIMDKEKLGATTVSSTMIAADMTGVSIFVTGGIGGVHRGYENTMDASADLRQLGRTPVTVVSAGVKSILDIARTLEYLQTEGVPVVTYKSDYFPAFFSASSGIKTPLRLDAAEGIARLIYAKQQIGLQNGILVAVPNPKPAEGQQIEKAIHRALGQMDQQGIKGSNITPFLLRRVNELTKGKSLQSNITLVYNNAQIGSKIAIALADQKAQTKKRLFTSFANISKSDFPDPSSNYASPTITLTKESSKAVSSTPQQLSFGKNQVGGSTSSSAQSQIIVIGGSAVDSEYRPERGTTFQLYKSCKGYSKRTLGGVGRNIAQVCARMNAPKTTLITPLGIDQSSQYIQAFCADLNINVKPIRSDKYSAAQYLTVLDDKNDEMIAVSQMDINTLLSFDNIYEAYFAAKQKGKSVDNIKEENKSKIVVIDANVNHDDRCTEDLEKLLGFLNQRGYYVVYECKGKKTKKIANPKILQKISLLRMNESERLDLIGACQQKSQSFKELGQNSCKDFQRYVGSLNSKSSNIICSGSQGTIVIVTNKKNKIKLMASQPRFDKMYRVVPSQKVIKTTGAGDSLTGALLSMMIKGNTISEALPFGLAASRLSIETANQKSVISDQICQEKLRKIIKQQTL